MAAYMYAIKVNYEREQIIQEHRKIVKPPLTLEKLTKLNIGNSAFTIREEDERFSENYVVYWRTTRPETDEEMNERIEKQETYNRKREIFLKEGKIT